MLNRLHPFCYKHNTVHSCVSVVIEFTTKYSLVANEVIIYLCSYTARELSQHQARCCWQNHQVYMLHGIRPAKSHSNSSRVLKQSNHTLSLLHALPQQRCQAASGTPVQLSAVEEMENGKRCKEKKTLLSLSFLLMAASLALRVSCQSQPGALRQRVPRK